MIGSQSLARPGKQFSRDDDRRLQEITTRHFPSGFTILEATGGWYDGTRRKFVREESRQILIVAASLSAVRRWARELGAALQQKELLIVEVGRAIRLKVES